MPKTNFASLVSTFMLCFGFWLLITWSLAPQEMIAGAVISLAAAWFCGRFFIHAKPFYLFNPTKLLALKFYCLVTFPVELFKANWDMAKRALSPNLNINPGIVKVPSELQSEYALSMLANSITLTPGTITMDIAEQEGKNYYYIHWIDVSETEREKAGDSIKGALESGIRRIWR
ncbi:MAG: Na+/H+ antiporter subunit E [Clostridiales bacterium]|nr:Na+/H+ antiporter subunit E [Clostridiales bacterium]